MSERVKLAFKKWDKDASGTIKRSDLSKVFRYLDPKITDRQLDTLYDGAAMGGADTRMSYEQFLNWVFGEAQRPLWAEALSTARSKALKQYPAQPTKAYFDEEESRLSGKDFAKQVKGAFFAGVDSNGDSRVSFEEAAAIIEQVLQSVAEMQGQAKPSEQEARRAFDAHDSTAEGRIGPEAFLNLVRYLQVQVVSAMLPSRALDWRKEADKAAELKALHDAEALKKQGLWEETLNSAIERATQKYPPKQVKRYFGDVKARLVSEEYQQQVQGAFFAKLDVNHAGTISFDDATGVIDTTLQCVADMAAAAKPTQEDIRNAFDAHDTMETGRGRMGGAELLNLVRYLQIKVAEATLIEAEQRVADDMKRFQAEEAARAMGLWEGALSAAKAKAAQKYDMARIESYFEEVRTRLSSAEYSEHVKGSFFQKVDTNKDGKVSFEEALSLIHRSLQCVKNMGGSESPPTHEEIRAAFDAHDTEVEGWNFMGGDEFLNLMRYLQVRVAEAMLPLSDIVTKA